MSNEEIQIKNGKPEVEIVLNQTWIYSRIPSDSVEVKYHLTFKTILEQRIQENSYTVRLFRLWKSPWPWESHQKMRIHRYTVQRLSWIIVDLKIKVKKSNFFSAMWTFIWFEFSTIDYLMRSVPSLFSTCYKPTQIFIWVCSQIYTDL